MSDEIRFAHISDLHFGSVSFSPFQFFSKRWMGNLNYLVSRRKAFRHERLLQLISLFKEKRITHVMITGDFSTTSRQVEFEMGRRFVSLLEKEGLTVFCVPGNHDNYTKRAFRKGLFYHFFPSKFDSSCPLSLKEDKVTYCSLTNSLSLIALDSTISTTLLSAQGLFSEELQENLKKALAAIGPEKEVILINHFPFFPNDPPKKRMVGGHALQELLEHTPNVLLYLHGHTHRQIVADLRPSSLPILSDPGSTPLIEKGTCHTFTLNSKKVQIDVLRFKEKWTLEKTHTLSRYDQPMV